MKTQEEIIRIIEQMRSEAAYHYDSVMYEGSRRYFEGMGDALTELKQKIEMTYTSKVNS